LKLHIRDLGVVVAALPRIRNTVNDERVIDVAIPGVAGKQRGLGLVIEGDNLFPVTDRAIGIHQVNRYGQPGDRAVTSVLHAKADGRLPHTAEVIPLDVEMVKDKIGHVRILFRLFGGQEDVGARARDRERGVLTMTT